MSNAWILVADSAHAELYSCTKIGGELELIEQLSHEESALMGRDLRSDKHGRSFDSAGQGRHAMSTMVSPKEHEAQLFAKQLADRLEEGRTHERCDRLVLVAAPDFLGLLRQAMSAECRELVVEELAKHLVGSPAREIRARLQAVA